MSLTHYKTILTIAGSDCIGGARIQADLKTATSLGVYAMSAITAVTAQNSAGVKGYDAVSPDLLKLQLETIAADMTPDAVKTGMIPDFTSAEIIADFIEKHEIHNLVVDPVITATSGHTLSDSSVLSVMRSRLIPAADLITPNIPEAEIISGLKIESVEDARDAAEAIIEKFHAKGVLVKGGHSEGSSDLCDILILNDKNGIRLSEFHHPRVDTPNTHGTGCTLSSAIASFLALGLPLADAVGHGIDYLQLAIRHGASYSFGRLNGHGPVDHMFRINTDKH